MKTVNRMSRGRFESATAYCARLKADAAAQEHEREVRGIAGNTAVC